MKWPAYLVMMRHDVSAYNILKEKKDRDPVYQKFVLAFNKDPFSQETKNLAEFAWKVFRLNSGDHNTPLVDPKSSTSEIVGTELRTSLELPDIIFLSPFDRTKATLNGLMRGWPELRNVKCVEEERIREQGHGLSLIYNDSKIFYALNPEQKMLRDIEGPYWYQYPQGESVPMVRDRNRSWLTTLTRDFVGKKVLAVTHHLNILATRANLERWGENEFTGIDEKDKPINCGITIYRGNPNLGENGRFVLECYNKKYF